MWKFGGTAEATVLLIEHSHGRVDDFLNYLRRKLAGRGGEGFGLRKCAFDQAGLLEYIAILLAKRVRDGEQDTAKAGAAVMVLRRKICSAIKWPAIGREETS